MKKLFCRLACRFWVGRLPAEDLDCDTYHLGVFLFKGMLLDCLYDFLGSMQRRASYRRSESPRISSMDNCSGDIDEKSLSDSSRLHKMIVQLL